MDNIDRGQRVNLDAAKSLEIWMRQTDIKLTQVNGQRKYGGPPDGWRAAPPGPGCEVFISQIPRDVYEDRLIPLFASVGPLWEFRLMMNFSGQNRGFAYAKYGSQALAAAAIHSLHGHVLEPGVRLNVRRSTEKRQLLLTELPGRTTREKLLQVLRNLSEGAEGVILKGSPGEECVSAVVVYSSHHAASMAKKVLVEGFKQRFGLLISVKWQSSPKPKLEERPGTPPSPVKPHRRNPPLVPPRHLRPPPNLPPPNLPPNFSRAVGGPAHSVVAAAVAEPPSLSSRQVNADVVPLLRALSLSAPVVPLVQGLYEDELKCSHTGPDGFLCYRYRVHLPGLALPFEGLVQVLPGLSPSEEWQEARSAMTQQVLQRLRALQYS